MFILGDLINIPESETRIPLPWWHRAPLALESRTQVYLAITKPKDNRPGDLLVSVLNPSHWSQSYRIRCYYQDAPGVIAKVFGAAADNGWNIALAESVTVEGGHRHALEIICEPPVLPPQTEVPIIRRDIQPFCQALLAMKFDMTESPQPLEPPTPATDWQRPGKVRNGWVVDEQEKSLAWREQLREQARKKYFNPEEFDFSKIVVSADTDNRVLRFVVPRRGVLNVNIKHADQAGALFRLTRALQNSGMNVLSSLLKRGGVLRDSAVLVAICEPINMLQGNSGQQEAALKKKIQEEINKIPPEYMADLKIDTGRPCNDVIYSHNPEDVIIRVPSHLLSRVLERRAKLDRKRFAVFLSQRFVKGRPEAYAGEVRRVLKECNCEVVQAPVQAGGTQTSFEEVSTAMWASEAGIVLVGKPEEKTQTAFSLNLAHEFGFFHGQGKPLMLLVEDDKKALAELDEFTNSKGLIAPRFNSKEFDKPVHPESISAQVKKWLDRIESDKLREFKDEFRKCESQKSLVMNESYKAATAGE